MFKYPWMPTSGVTRRVHACGFINFVPNPCSCAPILCICMILCSFVEPVTVCIIILIFTTLSQPVICNMSCIHNYIYQYYTVMYTIVHFHKLYASTCAFTFDNLHPVEQLLPRDATDAYLVHYGNNNIYHRRYAILHAGCNSRE